MTKKLKLYSLFHVNPAIAQRHSNLSSAAGNPIDIYLNCGRLLAASCRHFDIEYAIVTNQADYLSERLTFLGGGIKIIAFDLNRTVPRGISFYSAHFKLDLPRGFGEGVFGERVGLVDLDAVLVKPLPLNYASVGDNELLVYDISEIERASYGDDVIAKSLTAIGGHVASAPYWFGGEFILGSANSFQMLSLEIDRLWPMYLKRHSELHHQGDEMVVSAALKHLEKSGVSLIDVGQSSRLGTEPMIARWWSSRTLGRQIPLSTAARASILHLPADKPFLARMADSEFDPAKFLRSYRRHVQLKLIPRKLINPILNFSSQKRYYAPDI